MYRTKIYRTKVFVRAGFTLALLSASALPAYCGGLGIPSIEWGPGSGQVFNTVGNYSGPTSCNLTSSVNICTSSIASNQPPNFLNNPNGASSGTISASVDANGAHLYAEAGASGQADTSVTGYAQIYDTIYNPTANAAQFQLTFHLDAELYTLSSTVDFLQLELNNGNLFQTQLGYGGAGTYDFIDQDITTSVLTVAPNSHLSWNVVLSTTVVTDSAAANQYLAGYPTGFMDAGNTLSLTAISIFDAQGNPATASGLTSFAGFDYSHSTASGPAPTPEPATAGLFVAAVLSLLLFRKIPGNIRSRN